MNRAFRLLIIVAGLLYLIWPYDLLPGSIIDDFVVMGFAGYKALSK